MKPKLMYVLFQNLKLVIAFHCRDFILAAIKFFSDLTCHMEDRGMGVFWVHCASR